MKNWVILLVLLVVFSCKKQENTASNTGKNIAVKKPTVSYEEFSKIVAQKSEVEKKNFFFHYIDTDVPNYWAGTPWSFGGTTSEPKKGSVACGYFVTNVLQNYGFKIRGNYLAQQASSVMIKQLCTDVKHFATVNEVENYLLSKEKNQVYIVGLDFHTGFITRENKDTFFIHSNYINNKGVVKEKTSDSRALNASKSFMIGNLKY